MSKIYATLGLPGSGKSTAAVQHIAEHGGIRANRDDIRFDTYGVYFGPPIDENVVTRAQDQIVASALANGMDVWIDDTNLSSRARRHVEELARTHGVEVEWVDFTDIPIEVCIERDASRDRTVGEDVIRNMWERYLKNKPSDHS